jgi:anaerobic magnesium-protoporphyrin IX monomethyl ester cyclase
LSSNEAPRVALVFPYFRTKSATEMLLPPLGAATLAGQLRRLGLHAKVFDCTFGTSARLQRDLGSYEPHIVGIYAMVSLTGNALRIAEMVRTSLPQSLLVAGGPLPTVFPGRYTPHFDAVFRGEADLSFPRFCLDYFEQGACASTMADLLPLSTYAGLTIAGHDLAVNNPIVHHTESELRAFPLPDRSDFDHAAYQRAWRQATGTRTTSIIATLGCPYGCDFCSKPIFGNVIRRRDLDSVFAEIEQIRSLGYDSLWIADDLFTLNATYLEEFCRRIAGRHIAWSCLSRANGVDAAKARLMKEAGCRRVYLGLESGTQRTLELMNKQATVEQGVRTAGVYRGAGIEVAAFFIVGYPGETISSIEETFRLALTLPLDEISFNVPVPLPGSQLFERLGAPDEGRDWTTENEVTFVYPSEIDEPWLRRRVNETMRAFAEKQTSVRKTSVRTSQALPQAPQHPVRRHVVQAQGHGSYSPKPLADDEARVALEQREANLHL